MQVDASLPPVSLAEVPAISQAAEKIGFDALWTSETMHDPFLPGALIAEHTSHLSFGTAVAIAFARNPANMAYLAWDLARYSSGRFILGLGTQVKAHIERRFGMTWPDSVVGKLRDQIGAVRAIWKAWQSGDALHYQGEYFKLNLMPPFFNPGPIGDPDIPIYIAGVNTGLAKLAGQVADGFVVHPFHTPEYLRDIIIPAIENGANNAERIKEAVKISTTAFVVTSPEEDFFVRSQIAFYASTPSYRRVMVHHGWEDIGKELSNLARTGEWDQMSLLVSDEILSTFATVAEPADLSDKLNERYKGLTDRLGLYLSFKPGERDAFWIKLIRDLRK